MKRIFAIVLICISSPVIAQKYLNLDFEYTSPGTSVPQKWFASANSYTVVVDTSVKISHSGSLRIKCDYPKEKEYGVCSGMFPADLARGRTIEFKGMVKTQDLTGGYAGLWWRVDGEDGKVLKLDNMSGRGLVGTNDWKELSIRMKVDGNAASIWFGALFAGKGTAWFDNFRISVDGVEFKDLKPRTEEPKSSELAWLNKHIYPLRTYDPGSGSDKDLEILKKLIGDARIVALGETSHGSSEIFRMKHRIIKYLAENAGFNIFSIEANMPEAYKISDYTLNGNGNPSDLIRGMYFWTWRTQEVLDMVEWMREFNKTGKKISFTGFDMQYHTGAIRELNEAFKAKPQVLKEIADLNTTLESIALDRRNSRQNTVSREDRLKIEKKLKSVREAVAGSGFQTAEKNWLLQNIRVIEQYLDVGARDKYMAENLLWIKSHNPDSRIVAWAHNGHIQKTSKRMGNYIADSLGKDYLTIGFTFHKGSYTAVGKNGLTSYQAQESYPGTYEYFFKSVNVPVFILDLREAKRENPEAGKWLLEELPFRSVGAMKMDNEFSETDLTADFDLLIFINESTSSHLLD